ncbi:beta-hexosaminidase subunit beta-like [Gigantopelta aegis]|uniref:beta-hexosaminidase subunit beta-like n=1 Tax=Gigantopelta aegis TaxID=1735272 RepID=UPI001B88AEC2|nr:beta-hexosaminidase subunit beta-like [Gigantopelta aegis]
MDACTVRTFITVWFWLAHLGRNEGKLMYIAVRLPLKGERSPPGSPWPLPAQWSKGSENRTLDPRTFTITSDLDKCDIIDKAIDRYSDIVFGDVQWSVAPHLESLKGLEIKVLDKTCTGYPQIHMDESYNVSVSDTATLRSVSVWGALRGLETFSQLVYVENGHYMIRTDTIQDRPRYTHRGLMIDTARHYIPVPFILKQLDAIAYNKMNVLHWHIVDDQSFPYVSSSFPELAEKGAYSQSQIYTPKDVKDIIEYARLRGIRVIPEFDTPGHTQSFGKAFKYLMTTCWFNNTPATAEYGQHARYENFDPTKNTTYEFLAKFFTEIKDVFKDSFIHMGMDEAHYMCWQSSPNISEFMKQQGYRADDYFKVEEYYVKKALDIISGLNKRYIIWQDPVEHNVTVSKESIIQVWKNKPQWPENFHDWRVYMQKVASSGYKIVFSSCWYLNNIRKESSWQPYYLCDPEDFDGTQQEKKNIVGGEACLWAEHVDETNMIPRTWPRASAVAERLWSPKTENNTDSAQFRLHEQRCRMKRRGISSEPLGPGSCDPYHESVQFKPPHTSEKKPRPVCSTGNEGYAPNAAFVVIFSLLTVLNWVN